MPTPAIDRLAAEGTLFRNSYCDMPWTTGSMASVMTGFFGPGHGVRTHWERLSEDSLTLAEVLNDNGFVTAAIVGSFAVDSIYGLDQGFSLYDDDLTTPIITGLKDQPPPEPVELYFPEDPEKRSEIINKKWRNDAYRLDTEVTEAAATWLENRPEGRFFLWLHYFGPHERIKTGQHQGQRILNDYDWDLLHTDEALRRLLVTLDATGLTENTLVVFHSDHGQSLAEHKLIGHSRTMYEPEIRIPLIFRHPRSITPDARIDELARNVDIMPSILDYLRLPLPAGLAGRSLKPMMEGEEPAPSFSYGQLSLTLSIPFATNDGRQFFGPTSAVSVREGPWKYVRTALLAPCYEGADDVVDSFGINPALGSNREQLPDDDCEALVSEMLYAVEGPGNALAEETQDESAGNETILARLKGLAELTGSEDTASEPAGLSPEAVDKLRSLGYLGGSAAEPER